MRLPYLVACFLLGTVCATADPAFTSIRAQFIEVETVARLDYSSQKAHLRRLYFTLLPKFRKNAALAGALAISPKDMSGTPEVIADRILAYKYGGQVGLNSEALTRCRKILRDHPGEVIPWISKELREGGIGRIDSQLLSKENFTDLVSLLQGPDDVMASKAAGHLCDPRLRGEGTIALIVKRFPSLKLDAQFEGYSLQIAQQGQKASPELVGLLSAEDAEIRLRAIDALMLSGDAALKPHAEKLLRDSEPRVRAEAARFMKFVTGESPVFPQPIQTVPIEALFPESPD